MSHRRVGRTPQCTAQVLGPFGEVAHSQYPSVTVGRHEPGAPSSYPEAADRGTQWHPVKRGRRARVLRLGMPKLLRSSGFSTVGRGLAHDRSAAERQPEALSGLSPREREILALIGDGLTNRQIGRRPHLSEKAVKNHISCLPAKLGVERRIQAAVVATQADSAEQRPSVPDGTRRHHDGPH